MMGHPSNRKPDRDLLLGIVAAMTVSNARVRRNRCGDWNIVGRRGHISTDGVGQYVYLRLGTKRKWENAKRTLSFLTVTQDGDDEGVFKIAGPPTSEQAELLRKRLGLRKLSPLTEEQRTNLRRFSFRSR